MIKKKILFNVRNLFAKEKKLIYCYYLSQCLEFKYLYILRKCACVFRNVCKKVQTSLCMCNCA